MNQAILNSIKIQRKASDPKNNVYLSASAGTGKTKTLIDRILRLLLDGEQIENILCITFTNVAIGEMLNRLRDEFKKWHIYSDEELKKHIKDMFERDIDQSQIFKAKELYNTYLNNFDKIRIQTLHSLCVDILNQSQFIQEDKLENLKIIDEYNRKRLIEMALENVINLSKTKPELHFSIGNLAKKYDYYTLLQLISDIIFQKQEIYQFINSQYSIMDLINGQYDFYNSERATCYDDLFNKFISNTSQRFKSLVAENKDDINMIHSWLNGDSQFKNDNLTKYFDCFLTKSLTMSKRLFNKQFRDRNKDLIEECEKEQIRIIEFLEEKSAYEQAQFMECLIIILNETIREYEELKGILGYLEYDDLVLRTLEILNEAGDSEILLYSLNLSFSHILIDEAQDISKAQWHLLQKMIKSTYNFDSSIFIVGDYKQSIYGFQGADPEYFLTINQFYKTELKNVSKPWECLELSHSFRSKKEILEAVDKIFNSIDFVNKLNHIAIKKGNGIVKVIEHFTQTNKKTREKNCWKIPERDVDFIDNKLSNTEEIANFIFHLLNQDRAENKIMHKDIMVLFRKRSEKMKCLVQILKQNGTPISEENKINFSDDIIILDLLSIIKFFLLPDDDFNLICLLKSAFFNFTEEQIFKISYNRNEQNVFSRLQNLHPETSDLLQELEEYCKNQSLYDFYTDVLYKNKFISNFCQEFGTNCQEIIDIFLDKILEFEKQSLGGKEVFLGWLQYNSNINVDNNNSEGIKIMTVHAAKGLQAPIIILADAGDSENMPNENFFWYNEKLIIPNVSEYKNNTIKEIINQRKVKLKQESLRLLYVAMTRAEDELYIFGDSGNKKDSWYSIAKTILADNFVKYFELGISDQKHFKDEGLVLENFELPSYYKEDYIVENIEKKEIASLANQLYSNLPVARGNFIHQILSDASKIPTENFTNYIANLAGNSSFNLIPKREIEEIKLIAKDIVHKFPDIFINEVLSEVSINNLAAKTDTIIKIDKLIVKDDNIEIIEIKADKAKILSKSNLPDEYSRQIEIYKQCISHIYPNKKISCKILSFYQKELICL
ncbi:UvrD-helicase domain-containing protein [Candidatus Bandiella numerosa]|uniref:UvrD-helicase domain-containing protein n=1 Tax=Candidatus Bandiella numerosa TaxID=2570586 RepID=UPI001F008764|nr:UvrD-helicase domain-containing protein [Candidatus Bandiella numerosa]